MPAHLEIESLLFELVRQCDRQLWRGQIIFQTILQGKVCSLDLLLGPAADGCCWEVLLDNLNMGMNRRGGP